MRYLLAFLIGYPFGCILTADIVCRLRLHRSAFEVGVGNPGMANIGHEMGAGWAIAVLAGDVLKTVLPILLVWHLFGHDGALALWAGLGTTAGHDFPIWHRLRGGKGVATTCSAMILAYPALGLASCLAGFFVSVAGLGYLCLGALLIPAVFLALLAAAGAGLPALAAASALALLMASKHLGPALHIRDGSTPRAAIADELRRRLRRQNP